MDHLSGEIQRDVRPQSYETYAKMLIGLHFNPIHHGSIASVSLTQLAPVATALDEMTQNNLYYAVQCHLR